jgi:hypothetical protein
LPLEKSNHIPGDEKQAKIKNEKAKLLFASEKEMVDSENTAIIISVNAILLPISI